MTWRVVSPARRWISGIDAQFQQADAVVVGVLGQLVGDAPDVVVELGVLQGHVELVQVVQQGVVQAVVPLQVVAELLEIQAGHGAVVLLGQLPEGFRPDGAVEMAVDVRQGQGPDEVASVLLVHALEPLPGMSASVRKIRQTG